jgi:hypothetical protein
VEGLLVRSGPSTYENMDDEQAKIWQTSTIENT